ncbi:MAG: ABC transporter permease, partial [Acetobacteraceae bacterium]|nr:ABC transporter permease [Acetobacteraceae bacterium]
MADADALPAASAAEERVSVASNWTLVWWRFRRHKLAMASLLVLLVLYAIVLCPAFFSTQDPERTDARQAFVPVQALHLFDQGSFDPWVAGIVGRRNPVTLRMEWKTDATRKVRVGFFTAGEPYSVLGLFTLNTHLVGPRDQAERIFLLGSDRLGRDQFSRIMHATQTSMTVGLIAVALSTVLGVLLGGLSGYLGGLTDQVIQRLIELLQSVPTIPIWLALSAALPRDWSPTQVFFAITVILSLVGWTTLGREVRGRFLSLREEDFVLAARLAGASRLRIVLRHMVPTFSSHIIAAASLAIPVMIISETSLSFLGLG